MFLETLQNLGHIGSRIFGCIPGKSKEFPFTGREGPQGMWKQESTYTQPWQ